MLAKLPPADSYKAAVFPKPEDLDASKELVTKQWDAVVGANVQ